MGTEAFKLTRTQQEILQPVIAAVVDGNTTEGQGTVKRQLPVSIIYRESSHCKKKKKSLNVTLMCFIASLLEVSHSSGQAMFDG